MVKFAPYIRWRKRYKKHSSFFGVAMYTATGNRLFKWRIVWTKNGQEPRSKPRDASK